MKQIVAIVAVVVIVAVGWLAFGGKNDDNQPNNQGSNQTSTQGQNNTNNTNETPQPVATNKVNIADMAFSPADITVKAGTQVTWTNNDSTAHTVTENDSKDGPDSSPISPGQSYSFTFSTPGTYEYICSIHPQMTGTVTVTE